jgi:hypothetical protein
MVRKWSTVPISLTYTTPEIPSRPIRNWFTSVRAGRADTAVGAAAFNASARLSRPSFPTTVRLTVRTVYDNAQHCTYAFSVLRAPAPPPPPPVRVATLYCHLLPSFARQVRIDVVRSSCERSSN